LRRSPRSSLCCSFFVVLQLRLTMTTHVSRYFSVAANKKPQADPPLLVARNASGPTFVSYQLFFSRLRMRHPLETGLRCCRRTIFQLGLSCDLEWPKRRFRSLLVGLFCVAWRPVVSTSLLSCDTDNGRLTTKFAEVDWLIF
jgi:hypothetical protein